MGIAISELPMQNDGRVYHLNIQKEHLAGTVLLVGDPGRVKLISSMFDKIEVERSNREIITNTGILNGKRVSVMSTGMGPDNIDIVVNELDAIVNIDFESRSIKDNKTQLNLIRIGTCGSIQADLPVESFIASTHGLGIDGLMNFYKTDYDLYNDINEAFIKHTKWSDKCAKPYLAEGSKDLLDKIAFDMPQGITCTAPGFYGPQGRQIRLELDRPDINSLIESFNYKGHRIMNLEMETSALYGLSKGLGHNALTVCLVIANRVLKTFSENYKPRMHQLIETVLERI